MTTRERMMDFVNVTLEDRTRKYQMMDPDNQGFVVCRICAELELDGWVDDWSHFPNGIKAEEVMRLWKRYGR